MSKKATIIAVVNQKGGTGKTTTTENLGVGLALEGKKVLLVDTDPQASLTVSLGNPCPDDLSPTLSDLMGKIMMENPITPDEGILHHPEGVELVRLSTIVRRIPSILSFGLICLLTLLMVPSSCSDPLQEGMLPEPVSAHCRQLPTH